MINRNSCRKGDMSNCTGVPGTPNKVLILVILLTNTNVQSTMTPVAMRPKQSRENAPAR